MRGNPPKCMGGILQFNLCNASLLLAALLNTSSYTYACVISWSSTVVTHDVHYENTQPIVGSQTRGISSQLQLHLSQQICVIPRGPEVSLAD